MLSTVKFLLPLSIVSTPPMSSSFCKVPSSVPGSTFHCTQLPRLEISYAPIRAFLA